MRRKLAAICLAAALTLSALPASAAGTERFPSVNEYPGYADVPAGIWYGDNAKICYETGLIMGTDRGFEPGRVMQISEAAAIAARMHHILSGGDGAIPNLPVAANWYDGQLAYLRSLASGDSVVLSLLAQPEQEITRLGFLRLLAAALPEEALSPINTISALPDSADSHVLRFYNAGILTGVSQYGFFRGSGTLSRAEAAAMVSRVAREDLRQAFSPTFDAAVWASGMTPDTVLFQGGGKTVTAKAYLNEVVALAGGLKTDYNWNDLREDGRTQMAYVKETALSNLGVSAGMGTLHYQSFDLQVFYSHYLDLTETVMA